MIQDSQDVKEMDEGDVILNRSRVGGVSLLVLLYHHQFKIRVTLWPFPQQKNFLSLLERYRDFNVVYLVDKDSNNFYRWYKFGVILFKLIETIHLLSLVK